MLQTKKGRLMLSSKCAICGSKKSKFMKEQEGKGLLSNLGDVFMPELHLKETGLPGFSNSACGPFTKSKQRIQKFIQTEVTNYIYKNDLDKACFQHDTAYDKYKDLTKITQSDKYLRDKAFETARNPKYNGYQRGLAAMVYKIFDKKTFGAAIKSISNQQLESLFFF